MNPTKRNRLYVQLGRAGDILNVLPLLLRDFTETGNRPWLLVAEEFRELLDGVNYVVLAVYEGSFEDSLGAYNHAEKIASVSDLEIVCTQIYGREIHCGEKCSSFLKESWARVPDAPAWGSLPLVFDRRDLSREVGVRNHLLQRSTGKPYVVLALSGRSSPFPEHADLSRYLRNKLGHKFEFVDVSAFLAPRFYDLLTLLEGAHAIVSIDSAVLHLAAAVPLVPVVALITRDPTPWHGSAPRPQQVVRFFYDEAPGCFAAVAYWVAIARDQLAAPAFLHAWCPPSDHDADGERRSHFARATWYWEGVHSGVQWRDRRFPINDTARTSKSVGDSRGAPFMKDVIDHALEVEPEGIRPGDVVVFSNSDVSFVPGITRRVIDVVRRHGAAFTHRWDFPRLDLEIVNEEEVQRGAWYPGSDAFFFTVAWWRKHRDEYPDMVLGREHCDEVLRQLIKRHGGLEVRAAVYHEKHPSFWESPEQHEKNAGNRHNRRLARRFFLKNGYGPNDPVWWRLP